MYLTSPDDPASRYIILNVLCIKISNCFCFHKFIAIMKMLDKTILNHPLHQSQVCKEGCEVHFFHWGEPGDQQCGVKHCRGGTSLQPHHFGHLLDEWCNAMEGRSWKAHPLAPVTCSVLFQTRWRRLGLQLFHMYVMLLWWFSWLYSHLNYLHVLTFVFRC